MLKKKLAIALSAIVALNFGLSSVAFAATSPTQQASVYSPLNPNTSLNPVQIANIRQIISAQLSELDNKQLVDFNGASGMLYDLNLIICKSLWVDYMTEYQGDYKYSSSAIKYQTDSLIKQIEEFNSEYSKGYLPGSSSSGVSGTANTNGGYYQPCKITDYLVGKSPNVNSLNSQYKVSGYNSIEQGQTINCQGIIDDATQILSTYLTLVRAQIKGAPSSNPYVKYFKNSSLTLDGVVRNNKEPLVLIYGLLKDVNKNFLQIENSIPDTFIKGKSGDVTGKAVWERKPVTGPLSYIISSSQPGPTNYKMIQEAVNLNVNDLVSLDSGLISSKENLLQNFYQQANTETGSLKNFYWQLFACSSVYVPMTSYLNSQNFQEAFEGICPNNAQQFLNFYSNTVNYLKPLYYRALNQKGQPVGTAKMITLGELQSDIQSHKDGALVMVKGTLHQQPNTDTYVYYNMDRFAGTSAQTNNTAVSGSQQNNSTNKQKTTNSNEQNNQNSNNKENNTDNSKQNNSDNKDKQNNSDNKNNSNNDKNNSNDNKNNSNNDKNNSNNKNKQNNDNNKKEDSNNNKKNDSNNNNSVVHVPPPVKNVPVKSNNIVLLAGGNGDFDVSNNGESTGVTNSSAPKVVAQNPSNGSQNNQSSGSSNGGSKEGITFNQIRTSSKFTLLNNVSNNNSLTPAVFEWQSAEGVTEKVNMGQVVGANIFAGVKLSKTQQNEILYMDAYGDIVTSNGLVVIPGAENPTLLNENQSYYPYTVGFLSTYPSIINGQVGMATSASESGKYSIYIEDSPTKTWINKISNGANTIGNIFDIAGNWVLNHLGLQDDDSGNVSNNKNNTSNSPSTNQTNSVFKLPTLNSGNSFTMDNTTQLYARELNGSSSFKYSADNNMSRPIFLSTRGIGLDGLSGLQFQYVSSATPDFTAGLPLFMVNKLGVFQTSNSTKPIQLFPSDPKLMTKDGLRMVSEEYLWSLFCNKNGSTGKAPNGRINQNLIARTIVPQALDGSENPQAFEKNQIDNLQNYAQNQGFYFTEKLQQLATPMINKINQVPGVLGLENAYNNVVIKCMVNIGNDYIGYIILLLILVCIARYLSLRTNLFYTISTSLLVIVFGFLFVRIVPIYLPTVYNVINNNISSSLSYDSLMMSAENYQTFYKPTKEINGRVVFYGPSITLYKANTTQYNDILASMRLKDTGLITNKDYIISASAGTYLTGNQIEENIQRMFQTFPITGKYVNTKTGMAFQYQAQKVSSNIDYYTPYYLFATALVDKLNTFSDAFKLTQHQFHYGPITKGAFVVNDYLNSAIFLYPDDYTKYMWYLTPQQKQIIQDTFKKNNDPFGLYNVFYGEHSQDYNTALKDSLWFRTMIQNGFTPTNGKLVNTLNMVDLDTREFVNKNASVLSQMSDDNAIKVIALYETMMFDQKVTRFDNCLYPMFLNYTQLNLGTVLLSTFVTNGTMFESQNMQIVPYIAYTYSWFTLLIFIIVNLVVFLNVCLLQYMIPIFYMMLGVLLLIKFFIGGRLSDVAKGYAKTNLFLVGAFTVHVWCLDLAHAMGGSVFAFWFLLVVESMITETIMRVIWSIFRHDPLNMGNSSIGFNSLPFIVRTTLESLRVPNLVSNITNLGNFGRRMSQSSKDTFKKYRADDFMDYDYTAPGNLTKRVNRYKGKPTVGYIDEESQEEINPVSIKFYESEDSRLKENRERAISDLEDPLDTPFDTDRGDD